MTEQVIIVPGLGGSAHAWNPLARSLDAVVVDRLEQDGLPTLEDEVAHVRAEAGRDPLIVAHSMGAFTAEAYARRHPVAGLVLVDPSVTQGETEGYDAARRTFSLTRTVLNGIGKTGAPKLLGPAVWRASNRLAARRRLPAGDRKGAAKDYGDVRSTVSAAADLIAYRAQAAELQRMRKYSLVSPEAPVVVLSAQGWGKEDRHARKWAAWHQDLAKLFPEGQTEKVKGSGHLMHIDRPDMVEWAVRRVRARSLGTSL
ncbi:alpha/beta fold hydrolase [Salininema proteolyticum]|uniref:Alpha/beta fold hydrolase n=1 Tax=Salininema proteolyticum TaxID=1607685 RepID=A0ABV8U1Y5_9ACTN